MFFKKKSNEESVHSELTTKISSTGEVRLLDLEKIPFKKSPNQSERNDWVRGIVLHHTGPGTFEGIKKWFLNKDSSVSAHYLVGLDGEVFCFVKPTMKAWHCGKSEALIDGRKRTNLNNCTVGIEILNLGILEKDGDKYHYEYGRKRVELPSNLTQKVRAGTLRYENKSIISGFYVDYPQKQINAVVSLCKSLVNVYSQIGPEDIFGHYQVATPLGRKNDPFGLGIDGVIAKVFHE